MMGRGRDRRVKGERLTSRTRSRVRVKLEIYPECSLLQYSDRKIVRL